MFGAPPGDVSARWFEYATCSGPTPNQSGLKSGSLVPLQHFNPQGLSLYRASDGSQTCQAGQVHGCFLLFPLSLGLIAAKDPARSAFSESGVTLSTAPPVRNNLKRMVFKCISLPDSG